MPTPTYDLIASTTLAAASASVTFSSIPATYRDLILVLNGESGSALEISYRFNGDTGSNYSWLNAMGFVGGTNTFSISENKIVAWLPNNLDANTRFDQITQIMDYSATDKHKTTLNRFGGRSSSTGLTSMAAGRWANTAAITSVVINGSANFAIGSTFNLYGVIS
jgi:hypothetical protein